VVVTTLSYASGNFTATVKNQGTTAISAGVYIDVGDFVDGQCKTYGSFLGSLAAGASSTIGTQCGSYIIPTGTHTITAFVDDVNRFAESNENNNQQMITVGTAPASTTSTFTLVNFGGNASANTLGLSGWDTVLKDGYTNYQSAGPDRAMSGFNGGYDFQGGIVRSFAAGNREKNR
jgi:hypothetical protein